MDLAFGEPEERLTADLQAAARLDLGDLFAFAIERAETVPGPATGGAQRFHAIADLAGRRFEDLAVDIVVGQPTMGAPENLPGTDLLDFAGVPR